MNQFKTKNKGRGNRVIGKNLENGPLQWFLSQICSDVDVATALEIENPLENVFSHLSVFKQEVHQSYFPFKPTPLTFKSYFGNVQGKEVFKKKKKKEDQK